jgi:DNA repair exonuclease SbcCD nuclease subunit
LTFKFLHFGDTHLGRKHPSSVKRKRIESGLKALEHCVQVAVEEEVDFIVHAGDFFDKVYPWHSVIDIAEEKLEPLKEHEIPMYVIRGNHDRSFGQDRMLKGIAIQHLENEYITLLDPQLSDFGEKMYVEGDEYTIYGLGYHSSKTAETLRDFEPGEGFNILLMHDFVDGVTRQFSDSVPRADDIAEKDWDYVAIGHDHQPVPEKHVDGTIFAATGGTIDYDFNREYFGKKLNVVEVEDGEAEVETRDIPQTLELRSARAESREELIEKIQELEKNCDIVLRARIVSDSVDSTELEEEILEMFDSVVHADVLVELPDEQLKEYDTGSEDFNVSAYLESALDEPEKFKKLHMEAEGMMRNEENMTSSGFNLKKDARKNLRNRVEEVLFDED